MITQSTGSFFTDREIKELKNFSFKLDIFLVLKNTRKFNFKEDKKFLFDILTENIVKVSRGSLCYLEKEANGYCFVTVGSHLFVVEKRYIS